MWVIWPEPAWTLWYQILKGYGGLNGLQQRKPMPSEGLGREGHGQSSLKAGVWRAGEGRRSHLSICLGLQEKFLFSCLGISPICFTIDLLV